MIVAGCGAEPTLEEPDAGITCEAGAHAVAVPEDAPYRLLAADDYVYWTTAKLGGPKRVRRTMISTGSVETLTETTREIGALAIDRDGAAYWVESTPGTNAGAVMVARPGAAARPLYTVNGGLDPFAVAIDETDIYWLVHDRGSTFAQTVFHGPKAGGSANQLGTLVLASSDQSIGEMATDGGFVYWSNGANLLSRLPRAGGTPVTVVDDLDGIGAFVVAEGIVHAVVRDGVGSIIRVDATTTSFPRSIVEGGAGARWSLALGQGRLYAGTSDDRIISLPVGGGVPTTEVAADVRTAGGVAIAGPRLYWANTATAEAGGAVRWVCPGVARTR